MAKINEQIGTIVTADPLIVKKFLVGKKGDIEEAFKQYKATIMWRYENKIDNVLDEPFEDQPYYDYATRLVLHSRLISQFPHRYNSNVVIANQATNR